MFKRIWGGFKILDTLEKERSKPTLLYFSALILMCTYILYSRISNTYLQSCSSSRQPLKFEVGPQSAKSTDRKIPVLLRWFVEEKGRNGALAGRWKLRNRAVFVPAQRSVILFYLNLFRVELNISSKKTLKTMWNVSKKESRSQTY